MNLGELQYFEMHCHNVTCGRYSLPQGFKLSKHCYVLHCRTIRSEMRAQKYILIHNDGGKCVLGGDTSRDFLSILNLCTNVNLCAKNINVVSFLHMKYSLHV